jgi:superfamily II DNA helicase RecQ
VLLSSPEMALKHEPCKALLREPNVSQNIARFVVDEGHCIQDWGKKFRTAWAELGRLRSFLSGSCPVLWCTATAGSDTLEMARDKLKIRAETSFHLNLGNDRHNITTLVVPMQGKVDDLEFLSFLVSGALPGAVLMRSILFFKTRLLAQKACYYLRSLLDPSLQPQIEYLHALRHKNGKRRVLRELREGKVNILCATNCAGMGQDLPGIAFVGHHRATDGLKAKTQFKGRAGRAGEPSRFVMWVEPSVWPAKPKPIKKEDEDDESGLPEPDAQDDLLEDDEDEDGQDGKRGRRKIDDDMRAYIQSKGCRRAFDDIYYSNPPHPRTWTRMRARA